MEQPAQAPLSLLNAVVFKCDCSEAPLAKLNIFSYLAALTSNLMKRYIPDIILLLALSLFVAACASETSAGDSQSPESSTAVHHPLGFDTSLYVADSGKVRSGDTFPALMKRYGLNPALADSLLQKALGQFDPRKMRAGNPVYAYYSVDSLNRRLEYFVYENSAVSSTVFGCGDSLYVRICEKPVEHQMRVADVTINSSLWNDMIAAGISPLLIVELADIYAWTVNFFALQKGDRFRAVYHQSVCEGKVVAIDSVSFAIYDSGPSYSRVAIRLDQKDGSSSKYWSETGESLRKAFLKAPLKFNRISSGFTYRRKHPVTGKVRAHTAVDYAAPKGTPVHAIGDGSITLCGWDGSGGGNRIKIRHMNGYESSYMHLSGFAKGIKAGTRVTQGQLIGYVGSTGTSTGPHLDFRIWKNGVPIDPLKMEAPAVEPIRAEFRDSLTILMEKYKSVLDNI